MNCTLSLFCTEHFIMILPICEKRTDLDQLSDVEGQRRSVMGNQVG